MDRERYLFVHAGTHKTGTTSIQRSFKNFDNGETRYLRWGNRPNHSFALNTAFRNDPEKYQLHSKSGRSISEIKDLAQSLIKDLDKELNLDRKCFIISGEDIPWIGTHGLQNLLDFATHRCCKLRLIFYIRRPLGFINSVIQQNIKSGMKRLPVRPWTIYRPRVRDVEDIFGHPAIEYRDFDAIVKSSQSLVADFSRLVNVFPPPSEVRVNDSISMDSARALYLFNRFSEKKRFGSAMEVAASQRFNTIIAQLAVDSPKFSMPDAYIRTLIDEPDYNWLRRRVEWLEPLATDSLLDQPISATQDIHPMDQPFPDLVERIQRFLSENGVMDNSINKPLAVLDCLYDYCRTSIG